MSDHIWRYLDLPKFIHLIANRALHFTRVDQFRDKFEGSYPLLNVKEWQSAHPESVDFKHWRKFVCVSCWYESKNESAAMWERYAKDGQGIAIRSTKEKLREALKNEVILEIKNVTYRDFIREKAEIDYPWEAFLYKRIEFESEKEFRAILFDLPESEGFENGWPKPGSIENQNGFPENGIDVPIDPQILIEKIVLSPNSKNWYKNILIDFLNKFLSSKKVNLTITESELANDPVYPKWKW